MKIYVVSKKYHILTKGYYGDPDWYDEFEVVKVFNDSKKAENFVLDDASKAKKDDVVLDYTICADYLGGIELCDEELNDETIRELIAAYEFDWEIETIGSINWIIEDFELEI